MASPMQHHANTIVSSDLGFVGTVHRAHLARNLEATSGVAANEGKRRGPVDWPRRETPRSRPARRPRRRPGRRAAPRGSRGGAAVPRHRGPAPQAHYREACGLRKRGSGHTPTVRATQAPAAGTLGAAHPLPRRGFRDERREAQGIPRERRQRRQQRPQRGQVQRPGIR
jgi:hypothetical protein